MPYGWSPVQPSGKKPTPGGKDQAGKGGAGGVPVNPDWFSWLFKGLGGLGGMGGGGGGASATAPDYSAMISQFRPPVAQAPQPGTIQQGMAQPDQTQMLRDALMALLFGGRNGTV